MLKRKFKQVTLSGDVLRIPISKEDFTKLKAEEKRTGLGGTAIFKRIENPPEGLNANWVNSVLSGTRKNAPPELIKAMLDTYGNQPNAKISAEQKPISKVDLTKLEAEKKRTGLGGIAIYNHIEAPPEGINADLVHSILRGTRKKAPPELIKAMLDTYGNQPNAKISTVQKPISKVDLDKLEAEKKRTGLGGLAIFNRIENPPEGLNAHWVNSILRGTRKKAGPELIKTLLATYAHQPNAKISLDQVPISKEDLEKLKAERKRTGLGGVTLISRTETVPEGVSSYWINSILKGVRKNAPQELIKAMLDMYAQQPDQNLISKEDFARLKIEEKRTGLGGLAIFNHIENLPEGISSDWVNSILKGVRKNVPPDLITTLLETYAHQPNAKISLDQVPISKEDLAKLKAERKRTGLGEVALLKRIKDPPVGLDKQFASSLACRQRTRAPPEFISILLDTYALQPNAKMSLEKKSISKEDLEKLKAEEMRTKLGGATIFNRIANPPEGTSTVWAGHVLNRGRKNAPPDLVKAMLDTYAEQPDQTLISKEIFTKLKAEEKRTGLGGLAIFNRMESPPDGTNVGWVNSILMGARKNAPPDLIKTLLDTYARQPDQMKISKEDLAKLKTEEKRTGLGGVAIFSRMDNPPDGTNADWINSILRGARTKVPPGLIKAILDTYARQPDQELISQEDFAKLKVEEKRTGLGGIAIFNLIANPPESANAIWANRIVAGARKNAPPELITAMLETYRAQPDVKIKRKPISQEDFEKLKAEEKRTGLGGYQIFSRMKNRPEEMSGAWVDRILRGTYKKPSSEFVAALLIAYAKQPTKMFDYDNDNIDTDCQNLDLG